MPAKPVKRPAEKTEFATKADVGRLEGKIDALRDRFDDKLEMFTGRLEQRIGETNATNDVVFKLILRQLEQLSKIVDDRQTIAGQRHEQIMAQLEKLLSRAPEN
jgi:hypothetical protein